MQLEDLTADATIELLSKCSAWTLLRVERTNSYMKSLVPYAFKRVEQLDLSNLDQRFWASDEKIEWLIEVILRCGRSLKSIDCDTNILVKVWLTPGFPERLAAVCPKIEVNGVGFDHDYLTLIVTGRFHPVLSGQGGQLRGHAELRQRASVWLVLQKTAAVLGD